VEEEAWEWYTLIATASSREQNTGAMPPILRHQLSVAKINHPHILALNLKI